MCFRIVATVLILCDPDTTPCYTCSGPIVLSHSNLKGTNVSFSQEQLLCSLTFTEGVKSGLFASMHKVFMQGIMNVYSLLGPLTNHKSSHDMEQSSKKKETFQQFCTQNT